MTVESVYQKPIFDQMIAIHLGQAGIQLGSAFWELMCLEQCVSPDGKPSISDDVTTQYHNAEALFDLGNFGNYIPRAILVDSEASVIDEVRSGAYDKLFANWMMINDKEDAANNYARGSYTVGKRMIDKVYDTIRKSAEHTDKLVNFIIFNSCGGGTGSGLSPLIALSLMQHFPKVTRSAVSIVPGLSYQSAIVEPYNMILQAFATVESMDINYMFENEAIFDICCKKLFFNNPSLNDINRIMALILGSISSPIRHSTTLRSSVEDRLTNLIPYPRIHYPIVRYAPINHMSRASYRKISTSELTNELFARENQSMTLDTNKGRFIALLINYYGLVNTKEIYSSIERQKMNHPDKFVEWSPTGFKVGICNQIPTIPPMTCIEPTDQSATMLMNSTAIREFFVGQNRKFDLMFEKKSFVHWFCGEGMEEAEFNEARDEIEILVADLKEIGMSEDEVLDDMKSGGKKSKRNISIRQPPPEENNDNQ